MQSGKLLAIETWLLHMWNTTLNKLLADRSSGLCRRISVRPAVCPSVTQVFCGRMRKPTEMPLGTDTCVDPLNIMSDEGPDLHRGEIRGGEIFVTI